VPFLSGEAWKSSGGNANGRKPGTRNKRTQEILDLISQRGDKDPIDFLSEIISKESNYPHELKVQAANYLLPYKHSKCGATPALRYIPEPVELPHLGPTSIDQANANINYISTRKAAGTIDLDFADSLIADNNKIASNLIAEEELKLKMIAQHGAPEQIIQIQGGLPELPGTNITMPVLNNGHTIDAIPAPVLETAETNSAPPSKPEPKDVP
jgi:hypothetical protein